MTGGRAAAVKIAIDTSSGTCDATLSVAADVDFGDGGGEGGGG